jgi:hypothetical protein
MLFHSPADKMTWDDIEVFCHQKTPEGAYLDYKQDFPAHLEKTIAAMANTLGGIILIGVEEDSENKPILPLRGVKFHRGLSERVHNIDLTNITPPVIPEVSVCPNENKNCAIVVVRIPQSHQTPHAIAANTEVYLRTGNRNKPEALARIDQIGWLVDRRRKSEQLRHQLYERAHERFANFYGGGVENLAEGKIVSRTPERLAISLCPVYPKDPFVSPPYLNEVYKKIKVSEYYGTANTFPLPDHGKGRIVQDGIVLNLRKEYTYHTELNCFGLYFYKQSLLHGQSVVSVGKEPLQVMRASEIFCRLDEFLDSAITLYETLGFFGPLEFQVRLEGISGMGLGIWTGGQDMPSRYCPDPEIQITEHVLAADLQQKKMELILQAAQRIAWGFDWSLNASLLNSYYNQKKIK